MLTLLVNFMRLVGIIDLFIRCYFHCNNSYIQEVALKKKDCLEIPNREIKHSAIINARQCRVRNAGLD